MDYQVTKNKIIVTNTKDFNIEHILECGQVFTYLKNNQNDYNVYSKDQFAHIFFKDNCYVIETKNPNYFVNYFDLNTNYSQIKNKLNNNKNMVDAIKYGYGIRILKQDLIEVIIGFIISANNHIDRIKKTMQRIREYGKNFGDYYAFPTLDELNKITEQQFRDMGAGYRAKYLVKVCNQLKGVNFDETFSFDNQKLKNWLLSLCGVGPKVADCILLFGYHRCASFPVDTWIEKVYLDIFKQKKSRIKMSQDLINYFGKLSGYAQQYLFFYKRSQK